jgi:ABC-type transport system substrate-binding protein
VNVTRPVIVEVDDDPIRWHGPTGGDYLSRWFAAASQRSHLDLVWVADDGLNQHYRVRQGASFSDGSPVRARDHARAIRAALTVPSLQRFLLDISAVRTSKDALVIELRRPAPHLPSLLRSVDLAPISSCGELSSGAYERAVRAADDDYWLEPVEAGTPPVRVLVRRDPHDAPARFRRGEVDVTCATAFPLDRVPDFADNQGFHTAPTAIEMCLEIVPGSRSAVGDAEFRRRLLGAIRYDRLVARCWHGVKAAAPDHHVEAPPSTAGSGERLHLGYWDYYPNLVVAGEVAAQLTENLGVEVELTPVDFTSGSAQSCDLLLALRGPLFEDPICALDMLDPARRDPVLAPLLRRLSEIPDDDAARDELRRAVRELCPVLPLLRLQGHWLQREGLTGRPWPPMDAVRFPRFRWSADSP